MDKLFYYISLKHEATFYQIMVFMYFQNRPVINTVRLTVDTMALLKQLEQFNLIRHNDDFSYVCISELPVESFPVEKFIANEDAYRWALLAANIRW